MDILIDCISLREEFGICSVERPAIPSAEQTLKIYEVDGRDGSLTEKGNWRDIELPINFNLLDEENIRMKMRKFKALLINAKKLVLEEEPDVFYKIKFVKMGDIVNEIAEHGEFQLTFRLEPFAYMDFTDTIYLTNQATIFNPGTYFSEPVITLYGSGNINLTIGETNLILKEVANFITINTPLKSAYKEQLPLNNKILGNFPVLNPGDNKILWSGNVTKIEIKPEWRYLL
ncbi:putative phage tail component, N-terminal domain-containing protein [Clostridium amylolyticum]|uniref:Putative phage tail component, N-terminal domain-containing protein n=1 Tax=Clostridium amylolyticum TaxID=1121298 RepID=A0A1M6KYK0_9CLOT|nr:distal tail protein Dit [Clostridium amylolyticum]SHJ63926.1 putative phage tail component, N-terminal domain-containing protein [Clostridium amylolyticum]